MRWPVRVAGIMLAAVALLVGAAAPASAHAYLVRSDPADGSVLAAAPSAITLSFSESVQLRDTSVEVLAGGGQPVPVRSVQLRRSGAAADPSEVDTEEPVELVVGLPPLRPDTYRVAWRTLSSDDLHATSGVLVFGVQRAVTAAGAATEPPPRPVEAALRWLGFLGAAALLGGLLLALLAAPGPSAPPAPAAPLAQPAPAAPPLQPAPPGPAGLRRRFAALAAAGGGLAVALAPLLVLAQVGADRAGRVLLHTGYGPRWLVREIGLLVLLAVAIRLRSGRARRVDAVAAALAIGAFGVTSALLGHAAAVSGSRPVWLLADAVHLTVALGWAGGVAVAALGAGPLLRRPDQRPAVLALLRAFGRLAAAGLAVLAGTGLLLAGGAVASLDALLLTSYGRTLLVKLGLAGLAALLALRTARLLRAGRPGLRRAVGREAAALAAVLGAAAVLAAAAPALGPRFAPPAAAGARPLASAEAGDLVETLSVRPNRPGRNVVGVGVFDSRRPAPGPVTGVSVTLRSADGASTAVHSARRAADGDWTVTVDDLRTPGRWRVTVTALRPGLPPSVAGYDWVVADPSARPPVVSAAPLAPRLNLLAGLLGLAALLAAGLARRRGSRPADRAPAAPPDPAAADPAAADRGSGDPAAGDPAAGDPSAADPGAADPGAGAGSVPAGELLSR